MKKIPALFTPCIPDYSPPDASQSAYLGMVLDIRIQGSVFEITWGPSYPAPFRLADLFAIQQELKIFGVPKFNEFHRTHWTIKHVNLRAVLREKGLIQF